MSNVLAIIERLGTDASLQQLEGDELVAALGVDDLDPAVASALATRDLAALSALLGASTNVVCGLFPGDEDEEEGEPGDGDEDEDDADDDADSVSRVAAAAIRTATGSR